jgi:hypothetical protein
MTNSLIDSDSDRVDASMVVMFTANASVCRHLRAGKLPVIAIHSSAFRPKSCLRETTMTFLYGDQSLLATGTLIIGQ